MPTRRNNAPLLTLANGPNDTRLPGGRTGVTGEHTCMTTRDAVTRTADGSAAQRPEAPLSVWQRLKLAAAVPALLAGVLLALPLLVHNRERDHGRRPEVPAVWTAQQGAHGTAVVGGGHPARLGC